MSVRVVPVDSPETAPFILSDRFRTEIAYFMSLPDRAGVPKLGEREYWVDAADARRWLDDGVFHLVSPLDTESQAEIELSEEQEAWLEWMTTHGIQRIRLE